MTCKIKLREIIYNIIGLIEKILPIVYVLMTILFIIIVYHNIGTELNGRIRVPRKCYKRAQNQTHNH